MTAEMLKRAYAGANWASTYASTAQALLVQVHECETELGDLLALEQAMLDAGIPTLTVSVPCVPVNVETDTGPETRTLEVPVSVPARLLVSAKQQELLRAMLEVDELVDGLTQAVRLLVEFEPVESAKPGTSAAPDPNDIFSLRGVPDPTVQIRNGGKTDVR